MTAAHSAREGTDTSQTATSSSALAAPALMKFKFLAAKLTSVHDRDVANSQGPSIEHQLEKYMMELQHRQQWTRVLAAACGGVSHSCTTRS